MTPETTTVVVYLLQYMLGVPPQPFSIVTVANLPSLEECTYLAHELLPGIPEPKFRCIRYQTTVAATPSESVAATWRAHPHDEDNAAPMPRPRPAEAAVSDADEDDEACAAGAVTCKLPDTVTGTPNGIRIPRTKIEHEFGTLFGTMPRDGTTKRFKSGY